MGERSVHYVASIGFPGQFLPIAIRIPYFSVGVAEVHRSVTMTHIVGPTPLEGEYKPRPSDAGLHTDAQELFLEDCTNMTTTLDTFSVPRVLRRSDVARIVEGFTLFRPC